MHEVKVDRGHEVIRKQGGKQYGPIAKMMW